MTTPRTVDVQIGVGGLNGANVSVWEKSLFTEAPQYDDSVPLSASPVAECITGEPYGGAGAGRLVLPDASAEYYVCSEYNGHRTWGYLGPGGGGKPGFSEELTPILGDVTGIYTGKTGAVGYEKPDLMWNYVDPTTLDHDYPTEDAVDAILTVFRSGSQGEGDGASTLTFMDWDTGWEPFEIGWDLSPVTADPDAAGVFTSDLNVRGHLRLAYNGEYPNDLTALAGLGTSPPSLWDPHAPWLADCAGYIQFGTGTDTAAGDALHITFDSPMVNYVVGSGVQIGAVLLTAHNAATAALLPYVSGFDKDGFTIAFVNAPAAAQAMGTYKIAYLVVG